MHSQFGCGIFNLYMVNSLKLNIYITYSVRSDTKKCTFFPKGVIVLSIKLHKNKPRPNYIKNSQSATCFGCVSHLQVQYTIVV